MVILVKIFKTEKKTIEIKLVRLNEVCGKVLREKNAYMSVKTALLKSFFITFIGFNWYSNKIL